MSEQIINPNNLPIVRVVENGHDTYNSSAGTVITATINNGNDFISISNCLVPADLQDYDFVWLEDEGVEAMWLDNKFIIDRSERAQPFKSSMSVKVLDWMLINWKVMLLVPIGLLSWWLVDEFGVKRTVINVVVWTVIWYAFRAIKRAVHS